MNMTYDEVLAYLDALQMHKIKLGLEAMQAFLEKVGRPETRLKSVHIAGTNGKGSVCAALSELLGRAGFRVGVYTSPHLSSVRERFRIGGDYISREKFAELGSRICEVLGKEQITYFEFTTALGFLWFAESEVDLVLLETGMGGRLDATNVVTPLVSVITSVSMDHEIYLGDSLAAIAGEKAGIIKTGVPVVSGAVKPDAAAMIGRVSREKGAPLYVLGEHFNYAKYPDDSWDWTGGEAFGGRSFSGLRSSQASLVQQENDSLSLAALLLLQDRGFPVSERQIRDGLAAVKWPGRMEYFEQRYLPATQATPDSLNGAEIRHYLLDGAHNPDGVRNMALTISQKFSYKRLIGLWGAMSDKDMVATLGVIAPLMDVLIITRPEGERTAEPEQLYALLDDEQKIKARCVREVHAALLSAQMEAEEGDLIVVGGSLYLIGAIRHALLGELA
ncbi:MAG: bifunctional folylpolyglutamate synthase/dihydrofolate synthase [Desulforhopalus sp.]